MASKGINAMYVAILASGQSLTPEDVAIVKEARISGKITQVIAVSNVGIDLAPWADALVSHDSRWWARNLNSNLFKGRKFCRNSWPRVEVFIPEPSGGCNSGYMAIQVARKIYNANKIILLGFDMHGTHYFGKHPKGLVNTTPERFIAHINQFKKFADCEIINCTPSSALTIYPFMNLKNLL